MAFPNPQEPLPRFSVTSLAERQDLEQSSVVVKTHDWSQTAGWHWALLLLTQVCSLASSPLNVPGALSRAKLPICSIKC